MRVCVCVYVCVCVCVYVCVCVLQCYQPHTFNFPSRQLSFSRFQHIFAYNHARDGFRLLSKGGGRGEGQLQWMIQDLWKEVWKFEVFGTKVVLPILLKEACMPSHPRKFLPGACTEACLPTFWSHPYTYAFTCGHTPWPPELKCYCRAVLYNFCSSPYKG